MQTVDVSALPILLTVQKAVAVSGLSRSEIYNRIGSGEIEARKMRRSTLVVTTSLLATLDNLPKLGK